MRQYLKHIILCLLLMNVLVLSAQNKQEVYFSALSLFEMDADSDAFIILEEYLAHNPADAEVNLLLAQHYLQNGNIDQAEHAFALAQEKYNAESLLGLSICAASNDDVGMVVDFLQKYFETADAKLPSIVLSMPEFNSINNTKEWQLFRNNLFVTKMEEKLGEIVYNLNAENYFDAILLSNQILSSGKNHKVYYYRALASFYLADYRSALRDIKNAIEIKSHELAYFQLEAEIEFAMEKFDESEVSWSKCIEQNNLIPDYYLQRAQAANNSGNYKQAHQDLSLYCNYFQQNDTAQYFFAIVSMNLERYWDAIVAFNVLIDRNPSEFRYLNNRADCFYTVEEWIPAINDFQLSLDINPLQPEIWYKAGYCALGLNDKEKACFYWQKSAHYNYADAQTALYQYCRK